MKTVTSFNFDEIEGYRFGFSPFGKPSLLVNIYYVDGLLIDTGQRKMQKEILEKFKSLPIKQIYVTHHHEDHTGNIAALQQHFNCPVYASKLCSDIMQAPPKISYAQKMVWGDREAYDKLQIRESELVTEKFNFKIIPIPGHATDMVALYEPNKRWLFSADLFINTYIGYFLESESITDQINSIKKILTLDFDVMLCAHKPIFENPKGKLQKKLHFLEVFYKQVSDLYHQDFSPNKIFSHLRLKEDWFIRILSAGTLSKKNMVKSVIRDIENKKLPT